MKKVLINKVRFGAYVVIASVIFSGCNSSEKSMDSSAGSSRSKMKDNSVWLAKVGNDKITMNDFDSHVSIVYNDQIRESLKDPKAKESVLQQLINHGLLYKKAEGLGYAKKKEYKDQLDKLERKFELDKKQILVSMLVKEEVDDKISLTDEDLKQLYEENENQFSAHEQRRARHILVKDEGKAGRILARIKKGEDFSKLAEMYSEDPGTKSRGGDLGWFKKGSLVKEFEDVVFSLAKSSPLSGVVKTDFGWHIIKLEDLKTVPAKKFEDVKSQLENAGRNKARVELFNKYVAELKNEFPVEINPKGFSDTKDSASDGKK